MAGDGIIPSRQAFGRISDAVKRVEGTGSKIDQIRRRKPRGLGASAGFWAEITASSSYDSGQFTYAWKQLEKTTAGYGGWTALTDGLSETSATGTDKAWNTIEDTNAVTATYGNGVVAANLDTDEFTFTLQAAPAGAIVWMRAVTFTPSGGTATTEYWFQYESGIDGSCDDE